MAVAQVCEDTIALISRVIAVDTPATTGNIA